MSPRAACRLATIGFTRVHDYPPGKVDWLAHGLPVEGTHAARPTAGTLARHDAITCALDDTVDEVLEGLIASHYEFALVLSPGGVLLGRIPRSALEAATGADRIEPIVEPGPPTIRPHLTIDELSQRLARSRTSTLIVTTPGGVLLGVIRREDVPTQ